MDHDPLIMPSATTPVLNPHGGPQAAMSVSPSPTTDGERGAIEQADGMDEARDKDAKSSTGSSNRAREATSLEKQAQELQKKLADLSALKGWAIQFDLVPELDSPVIRVVDAETRQVIRQIPSEEMLLMKQRLQSLAQAQDDKNSLSGLLFDGQV